MTARDGSYGRASFVERFCLRDSDAQKRADEVIRQIDSSGLESLRLSFADQHGILRGKTVMARDAAQVMGSGCSMTSTLLTKDTSHRTVYPVWSDGGGLDMPEMTGAGDFLMVPDPDTFQILPWVENTGWMQCDIYFPDGRPVPFCTRALCRNALGDLSNCGFDLIAGLEVELHLFALEEDKLRPEHATQPGEPPQVRLLSQGFQYLTEERMDEIEPELELLRRGLAAMNLPLRSLEVEFGPSQCELTLHAQEGLKAADTMILLRSAVKQIARRNGLHATFMCRPNLPNLFSSGWHLHQSLIDRAAGANAFLPGEDGKVLSPLGENYVGGLLAHAAAACVFTTPTINGYKRYRPHTLAPDRAIWGADNKGTMIRALGARDDPATRIENRIAEPAANPYLYIASQVVSGMDGINRKTDPGPRSSSPYAADAPPLPRSLMDAVCALDDSALFRGAFGNTFVDYLLTIKRFEISRFLSEVTDWEQREYFSLF